MAGPDRPTRIAADLIDAATRVAASNSRSIKQQLDYWIRLGRSIDSQHIRARHRIEAAIAGDSALTELTPEETQVAHATIDARLQQRARQVGLGTLANSRGLPTVSLDADGFLIRIDPDGATARLSDIPTATTR